MTIRVALHHLTTYHYDRPVHLGPQTIRLRPAPHCRTPVRAYSLQVHPQEHFLNWQQDPYGNHLARLVFREPTREFRVEVELIAEMTVVNPFDFFIEDYAERYPFEYEPSLARDLLPYREPEPLGPLMRDYLKQLDRSPRKFVDFLVDINQRLERDIDYLIRLEPGVQTCEETLGNRSGSCRDSAWLLVQLLRNCGLAARFVSGYLIQLIPDVKPLDGPAGPQADFTDLHAWTEVYVPGAGWIGLDPTSGLLAGEGHLPLACTAHPQSAAPISGSVDPSEVTFDFEMSLARVHESPRVTKPYTDDAWSVIESLGQQVDRDLQANDVRLTMGGEPTFVSIDDMEGPEWTTAAVGPHKQRVSVQLIHRLRERFAPQGLLHFGQGKWYPGESLPRWAYTCLWRTDGEPMWNNLELLADLSVDYGHKVDHAQEFLVELVERLGVVDPHILPVYEDVWHTIEQEQKLPVDVEPSEFDLDDGEERHRLARIIESGVSTPAGFVLPLTRAWWQARAHWTSGPWPLRSARLFLIPGDSPVGLRLPLGSLPVSWDVGSRPLYTVDPFAGRAPLPSYQELRRTARRFRDAASPEAAAIEGQPRRTGTPPESAAGEAARRRFEEQRLTTSVGSVVTTALCIEPRNGRLHVFLPPVGSLEDYLDLVATIEDTAEELQQPVVIEGYLPPPDYRINQLKVTPDPGVIEVNIQPAHNWTELQDITTAVYEDARQCRLGTEKFQLDGRHTGTGGGNHIVLGGSTPADSPFLRRPDLLRSLLAFWNNHPSLSYLFSGLFFGPTSQAPRVDEGRRDALYELELAFQQVPAAGTGGIPPWLVDRVFRHLLVDVTGNTHRAEFCIDKLYSPDSANGRLGLVEMRAFEMPPHARMSLAQQLLVRALVARFWTSPFTERLIAWDTALHDRWALPHFLKADLQDVLRDLQAAGYDFSWDWFAPHYEFRCPLVGELEIDGLHLEMRQALEPWYVLGEEPAGGGMARYVDSSVERMQVKLSGASTARYSICCNGHPLPLQPTGTVGESVAGVRYRAWQPPSCLQPTIPIDTPLRFDVIDKWQSRSLGGCTYYVEHPGGLNPATFPVNMLEAESRRAARFFTHGHSPGRQM
ncbi:MAG: transglutaminase family protein, partial [Planctomycetaceae bacterium]|nr:transglutaminase family protein [Planctomycetaceae bacterium]